MFGKKKVAMLGAELIGTAILALAVISVRSSGIGYSFFVALGAGLAMGALALVLGSNSGAQFNPALTIGLWTGRKIKTVPAVLYVVAQLLGGLVAYWFYIYIVKTHLSSNAGHFAARVMIAEATGAFIFAMGWAAAAAQKYEGVRRALTIGGAFALGVLIASLGSNGLINPAIALATRSWGWGTYILGPVVGGIVGVNLYNMLFAANGTAVSKKK
ncbi:MAG TPA: aquaporin [Candidatus Saccharimonadales bacterium]|nr:aquaporin [Candidatus Saccharimonadales bacterium]